MTWDNLSSGVAWGGGSRPKQNEEHLHGVAAQCEVSESKG